MDKLSNIQDCETKLKPIFQSWYNFLLSQAPSYLQPDFAGVANNASVFRPTNFSNPTSFQFMVHRMPVGLTSQIHVRFETPSGLIWLWRSEAGLWHRRKLEYSSSEFPIHQTAEPHFISAALAGGNLYPGLWVNDTDIYTNEDEMSNWLEVVTLQMEKDAGFTWNQLAVQPSNDILSIFVIHTEQEFDRDVINFLTVDRKLTSAFVSVPFRGAHTELIRSHLRDCFDIQVKVSDLSVYKVRRSVVPRRMVYIVRSGLDRIYLKKSYAVKQCYESVIPLPVSELAVHRPMIHPEVELDLISLGFL